MLTKNFDHREFESSVAERWEERGSFRARSDASVAYSIILPPPNVTGSLHVGHAQNHTLQDILIRYQRMQGKATLWQPGTDHAGIATQMMVERHLAEKGIQRREIGRDAFVRHIWDWKHEYGERIVNQQRRLGESCDWSRQRFTMDDGLSAAVIKVFVRLHRQNLIYRDKRLVNWDPKFQTALSDLEVESKTVHGTLYHIRYPFDDPTHGEGIVVATTRPETLFGDMAVAVHPEDPRYQNLIGQLCVLPLTGRNIPIIADTHADPEEGSGAVKITPAHDFNDFEVGRAHGLSCLPIMDKRGYLNDNVPEQFQGLERFEARKKVIAALESAGLPVRAEDHQHNVPHGDRSQVPLEPLLTDQWYLNAKALAQPAVEAVKSGRIDIIPLSGRNSFFRWMQDIQPWCISRQLWWGHRIPAWYSADGKIFVAENRQEAEAEAQIHYDRPVQLEQDPDVLDTWFSSALWPFSTLGWPDDSSPELQRHYPTDVLITGADILFFWVARMIMMGLHFINDVPFRTVMLHGLVRDAEGRKMSKTLGNVVDPLALCDEKGADALRMTLCALTILGRDTKFSNQRLEDYRNFITKLWNASRFLEQYGARLDPDAPRPQTTLACNHWILSELDSAIIEADRALGDYRFNDYAGTLYRLVWSRFCDWYIEIIKPFLNAKTHPARPETLATAEYCLMTILKLLHPVTPFVTEELYRALSAPENTRMLIDAHWPQAKTSLEAASIGHKAIEWLITLITTIRSMKVSMDIAPATTTALRRTDFDAEHQALLQEYAGSLHNLARLSLEHDSFPHSVRFVLNRQVVHIHLAGDVDLSTIRQRLEKESTKAAQQHNQLLARLDNVNFTTKAPAEVLSEHRARLDELHTRRGQYAELLKSLD